MAHCDSVGFAVGIAKALAEPLPQPSQKLDKPAMKYWPAIVRAKRLTAWTDIDLALATTLARDLVAIDQLTRTLAKDGYTLTDIKTGKLYAHPAANLLDQATRRAANTARAVQIHAIATTGRTDDQGGKNEAARGIAAKLDNVHDLIPRARPA